MSRMWFALLLAGLVGLTACQPREIVLEVTRIVETQQEVAGSDTHCIANGSARSDAPGH